MNGHIFFCGEATSTNAPGSIHGAMESAAACVQELLSLKKQKKNFLLKKRSKLIARAQPPAKL